MYPRIDAFDWRNSALENGSWDDRALCIYHKDGFFKAKFNKKLRNGDEKRIIRTISESQFEYAKELLYSLYVRATRDVDCKLQAERIDWFCTAIS